MRNPDGKNRSPTRSAIARFSVCHAPFEAFITAVKFMDMVRICFVSLLSVPLLVACSSGWREVEVPFLDAGPDAGPEAPGLLVHTQAVQNTDGCDAGGVLVEMGTDHDGDGLLAPEEVQQTITLCHGQAGEAALVEVIGWDGNEACSGGGVELRTGLDANGDGVLEEAETLRDERICFADIGANDQREVLFIKELSPGQRCAAGGVLIASGIDENGDGQLSENEVLQSAILCESERGDDGFSSLTVVDDQVGNACGAGGQGQRIRTGLDNGDSGGVPHNQELEGGEVDSTTYVCDGQRGPEGEQGPRGETGSASLIRMEPELGGPHCPFSGTRVLVGVDDNGDGVLTGEDEGDAEVDAVAIICSTLPGPCAEGYHDGGDLSCVLEGQCVTGYHDDGYGDCVSPGVCGLGFTWDGSSACFSRIEISFIPAGTFQRAGRTIEITRPFAMTETEITQGQWKDITGGSNPSSFAPCGNECPVDRADWYAAIAYANALSEALFLPTCYVLNGCADVQSGWQDGLHFGCTEVQFAGLDCLGFRLPTEAEWEYAYRAETETDYYDGDWSGGECDAALDSLAWYSCNSANTTHPAGEKRPNAWGLFDMSGNVQEWVWDWSGEYGSATTDPLGPASGAQKVLRGGAWGDTAEENRATSRDSNGPTIPLSRVGFRLVRTLPPL